MFFINFREMRRETSYLFILWHKRKHEAESFLVHRVFLEKRDKLNVFVIEKRTSSTSRPAIQVRIISFIVFWKKAFSYLFVCFVLLLPTWKHQRMLTETLKMAYLNFKKPSFIRVKPDAHRLDINYLRLILECLNKR